MKLRVLSLVTFLLSVSMISLATTRIVDSHYPQPTGVYSTIQLAYNAASPGDTILISPASGEYAGITIAKRVHIVGTGWGNASTTVAHTKTGGFTLNAGSQGTSITGLELTGSLDINADSVTIKRNTGGKIYVRQNCTNVVIIQNYLKGFNQSSNWLYSSIISAETNSEVLISNNIIINSGSAYTNYSIFSQHPSSVIVCNNVLYGEEYAIYFEMSGGNYITHRVYNNIILSGGGISGIAATFDENNHNMGNSTQFGTINNNQQNIDMNTVFVDAANNNYHLKEGSPAIGAGLGGTDCGIYGGTFPFVDNGRTWLPIITEISVPGMVNVKDGLEVSVKAKSGK